MEAYLMKEWKEVAQSYLMKESLPCLLISLISIEFIKEKVMEKIILRVYKII